MEEGDHRECSVKLLACPEHRDQQMLAMGHRPGYAVETPAQDAEEPEMLKDENGNPIFGSCLWCDLTVYSMQEHAHFD
jgi:hypothetical protein